jgi:hypothetical protein
MDMNIRKIAWIFAFILGAPIAIFSSFTLLDSLNSPYQPSLPPPTRVLGISTQISSPNYSLTSVITDSVNSADARPLIIRNYLRQYDSPLEPYYQTVVEISDKYSLDYRLLVAIAQQESNLCKKIPAGSHNCWGFGIYGDLITRFDNYPQALDTVARTLRKEYLDKGLNTPEKIMAKYTPPSVEIGGPWAKGVSQFMAELE